MATITMEWALWSEQPGARDDYTVLSCSSGRLRPAHFKEIIRRFSPGTPESEGFLPRVTISSVDIERRPYVGMAIQDRSDHYDGTGRRIAPTRFFLIPYESLGEYPASYRDLYTELSALRLPETGQEPPLEITVPALDAPTLAADLARLGPESALTAAAHLLGRGRVCLTQAEQTTFDERLRFLDTAVALLPYGYRAKLTATTWANSATRHNLRLYFARSATNAHALSLPWQESTSGYLNSSYAVRLGQLLRDHKPAQVIALLAAETEPRRLDGTDAASATLTKIAKRLHQRRLAHRADLTLEDLRDCLDDELLGPGEAEIFLRRLIPQARGEDLNRILRWLPRVAATSGLGPWRQSLVETATRLLWSEGARLHGLLQITGQELGVDRFLAELIEARSAQQTQSMPGLAAVAQLLIDYTLHDPAAYPGTWAALSEDVPTMLAMIRALIDGEEGEQFGNAHLRVQDMLPGNLRPLADRLTGLIRPLDERQEQAFTWEEIALLADHGVSCLQLALIIACRTDRIRLMARAFVEWIIVGGGLSPEEGRLWGAELAGLTPEEPSAQAMIDVVLLTIGHRPRWIMVVPPEDWATYEEMFAHLWNYRWPDRRQMSLALADHLRHLAWHDVPGRADQILRLQEKLILEEIPALKDALAESLSGAADLSWDPDARQWLAQHRPTAAASAEHTETRVPTSSDTGEAVHPAAPSQSTRATKTANEILDLIVALARDRFSAPEIYHRLAQQGTLTDVDVAVAVVERLPYELLQDKALYEAREWSNTLVEHLCRGDFGAEFAKEFEQTYLDGILDGINDRIRFIQHLDKNPDTVLGDKRNTDMIQSMAEVLQTIAGKKRPRAPGPKKPRIKRMLRKKDEENQVTQPGAYSDTDFGAQ
ncbi:hypothetical protein SAMN04489712_12289 [Thermomonospora echinospora]|uniref:Uncharacterized protein n=1 Tax=Thermomonospora echinospora TaxID=1992 RepID=A0A1H6DU71_9ACTN|nr:hypothetical protein [Thermomonospora echinospora]SEG88831.1 hypothetical protein SAMN04489712_12289 [Thermomonospora echinospora]